MRKNHLSIFIMIIIFLLTFPVFSKDIRIVCPYAGPIKDTYQNTEQRLNLEDHSLLKGVFFQWINPDRYQWNAFAYQASNINYSTLWGCHFIFDYYFHARRLGKFVIGTGIEFLQINMDADSSIAPLKNIELLNSLFIPYIRFGYRFQYKTSMFNASILPWMGAEYEGIQGDFMMTIDPPGPAPSITEKEDISNDRYLGVAGINFNVNFFHMLDLEAKYNSTFDNKVHYSTATAMINCFFTRHWGISYRVKYMELSKGHDLYNIFGVAFVF